MSDHRNGGLNIGRNTYPTKGISRRRFGASLGALSLSASPLYSFALQTQPTDTSASLETHAIYDARLNALTSTTKRQLQRANQIHTYRDDIAPIWYNALAQLWTDKNIQMFGITRHSEFFILKTLAQERRHVFTHAAEYQDHAVWLIRPVLNA